MDFSPQSKWLGLQIKDFQVQDETHAEVEFVARYKVQGVRYACMSTAALCKSMAVGFISTAINFKCVQKAHTSQNTYLRKIHERSGPF